MDSPRDPDAVQVAVVIPAWNAAATLADTLDSVLAQSHRNLDIVVVDDGSTDDTRHIAEGFAQRDPRVRVISQPNGGVARARNAGVAATSAGFIAPVDADDLWHPDKIRLQLEVILAGERLGFVYAPYRQVDAAGRCLGPNSPLDRFEGWVYLRHWLCNFVGNGSAMLIRREAFEQAGGYDPALRDSGLEGVEDWLLQLHIARRWRVGMVPLYLVGYRQLPDAMSADRMRMLRAILACMEQVAGEYHDTPAWLLSQRRARVNVSQFWEALKRGRPIASLPFLWRALLASPATVVARFIEKAREAIPRRLGMTFAALPPERRPEFTTVPLDWGEPGRLDRRMRRQMRRLAPLEGPPGDA